MAAANLVVRPYPSCKGFLDLPREFRPIIYKFCRLEDFIHLFRTSHASRAATGEGLSDLCFSFQKLHPEEIVKIRRLLAPLALFPSFSAPRLEICQLANLRPPYKERSRHVVCQEITFALKVLETSKNETIKHITLNYEFLEPPTLTNLLIFMPQLESIELCNCVLLQKRDLVDLSRIPLRALTFNGSLHLRNPQSQLNRQLLHRDIASANWQMISLNMPHNPVYTRGPFMFSLTDYTGYSTLETLALHNVDQLTDDQAEAISPQLSHLKSLTIQDCKPLSAAGVNSFLANPHLEEVTLQEQSVDDKALETLTSTAEGLKRMEIRALAARFSKPSDQGMRSLLRCQNLVNLKIALTGSEITLETLQELAQKWFATPHAESFIFRNREFGNDRFQDLLGTWRLEFEAQ